MLEPLLEAVRPQTGRELTDLRRTFEAITWRLQNGAKWRAIPPDLGPWWMAAQMFRRWARLGIWEQLFETVKAAGLSDLGMAFLDATVIRAHQKAAGARYPNGTADREPPTAREALGRSQGGYGTKAHALSEARGRALGFRLSPGQAGDVPQAPDLLDFLPGVPLWVVADRGYSSQAFRTLIWDLGATPAIPTRRNEAEVRCPDWMYRNRTRVERLWARLKEWRAVATRYEKTARSFLAVLHLAATFDWLKN